MADATLQPRLEAIRVNATDYDGCIVIEQFSYWFASDNSPSWAVPAWDERGEPDLAGPFATVADAERALAEAA